MQLKRLALFALGGTLGFMVDATVLQLLISQGLSVYASRAVSFFCAVWVTWRFNRRRTFGKRSHHDGQLREGLRYLAAVSLGGTVNCLGYALALHYWSLAREWPVGAVALGCLLGMLVNYGMSARWVFRPPA
ncbi:GtrA family protein [Pseudomonas sp. ZM23]|uniref:GtrA family protein n=1 Tax=Pseudomonas triclosanedens TaxID=2961893 RepID=A0ABY7A334_9PSED|nr:GtrA family protein [Pseudomonas triclosanedens]MCP8463931.1 GtrA family protein [Pseudomonas triclosanedens]MCP8469015.1 GtrA family protein [Pseudomonas triclosanedens]MCP8475737.1 GtrA family protein [Pseudomonas triclosanedens]WAI50553.1 GtrA family protein [Pseudomonas triclosanedens]